MEPEITRRYNDWILKEALSRYDLHEDQITPLDGFENYIYEFQRGRAAYILRIGHSRRRTVELIQGEVDWINYLADGGAWVARAIPSARGNLVESIDDGHDDGGQFLATAFHKAPGGHSWEVGWSRMLYKAYGRMIGRIHALSKDYTPTHLEWRRQEWDHPSNLEVLKWLPESETLLIERYKQIKTYLDALPRDDESYGLIHQDAHPGNLFVDPSNGQLTLFDFDDCVYGWYVYDIAMVVFYMIVLDDDPVKSLESFWPHFWAGYCAENSLDSSWLAEIPHFLKLREIDLYALLIRSHGDVDAVDPDEDPWSAAFLDGRKHRIEQDVPLVVFDFA